MLKTYKALLAILHSYERKYFTVSTEQEMHDAKRLRTEGGFRNVVFTVVDEDMYKVVD